MLLIGEIDDILLAPELICEISAKSYCAKSSDDLGEMEMPIRADMYSRF